MAITFVDRGTTIHNNDGNSSTVSMPAGVSAGDLFVGIAYLEDEILSGGSASTPVTVNFNADTLSAQERVISGTASGDNSTIYVFAKTLTSTDLVSSVISITNSNFDAEDIIFEHLYFSGDVPTTITDVTKNEFTVNPPQVASSGTSLTTRIGSVSSDLTISGSDAWNTTHYDHGSVSIHAYHHKNKKFSTFTTTPASTDTNWIIREAAPSISGTSASSLAVYGTNDSGFGTSLELQIVTTTNNNTKRQVGVVFAIPRTISSPTNHPLNETDTSETSDSLTSTKSVVSTKQDTSETSDSLSVAKSASSTATDTSDTSDFLSVAKSALLTKLDTSETSDTLFVIKFATLTTTDTSETSDSLSFVKSAASSNTDTSEASDTLSAVKATTESNTDTSEASDSLSAIIVKTSESTDASSAIDSATLNKSAESTSIEPATSIDSIVLKKTSAETITDTGSSVDVVTDLNASSEQKTDSVSSVDSLTITQTHNVVETDSVSIEDASVEIQTNGVTASDESQVVDSISVLKSFNVIITDISTSVDSIADVKSATQVNTDQSTSIDPIVLVKTHNVSQTDNVALEDNLTSTKQDQSIVNETDGATSQDALVISSTFNVVATDTNTSVDSIVLVLSHSEDIVDQSTTSDDPTIEKQTQNTVVNVTDSSTGVDSVVSKLDINESKIDPVTVEDLLSLGLNSVFIETDQSGAVDEVSLSRVIYFPSVTDPVSSSDTLDISVAKAQDIVDSGSGVDALTRKLDYELELSDSGEALDEIVAVLPEKVELQATITGVGGIDPNLMKEAQAVATIDVWNVALNALGISTLATTEGNNPQQTLLSNTFSLFRKQFLSDHLWNGAKRTTDLTKLDVNTTDQSVANRWKYVYVLPTDCMRVWRLNGQENKPVHVGGNSNIYTNRWEIEVVTKGTTGGDTNTGRYRALCTNEDEARIEYVFDVINDIDLLGPLTQHAMGLALAAFVATNFGKSASEIAQLEAQAKDAITAAKGVDGQEGTPQIFGDTSLLGVRSIGY